MKGFFSPTAPVVAAGDYPAVRPTAGKESLTRTTSSYMPTQRRNLYSPEGGESLAGKQDNGNWQLTVRFAGGAIVSKRTAAVRAVGLGTAIAGRARYLLWTAGEARERIKEGPEERGACYSC